MIKNNTKNLSRELFVPVLNYLKLKKYDQALTLLDQLLKEKQNPDHINKIKAKIYLNKKDWKNCLLHYEKISSSKKNFEDSNNKGVALFKLGRFSEAIDNFNDTIKLNKLYVPAYNNLSKAHKLLSNFELSIKYALNALALAPNNYNIQNSLFDILNYYSPKNKKNLILNINEQMLKLNETINNNSIKNSLINGILNKSQKILDENQKNLYFPETQILRKNKTNLNCKRHLEIFNKYKIIPNFCFGCYKVQITLNNVLNLIKLYFYFNDLSLEKNNIRKCMIEVRENVKGDYKGYIYTSSIDEAKNIMETVNKDLLSQNINFHKIEMKHGCTEYYEKFPEFKLINQNLYPKISKENWISVESQFDKENLIIEQNMERKFANTMNVFNLSDYLIIKNWLSYAKTIGDESYKKIFNKNLDNSLMKNTLDKQINFRKKELI